jgi:molecular chaperone DnaJ
VAAKDLYEKDYYQILGVTKSADGAAIKKQYRKLARELHPDKTKGDKKLEDRFKAVSEAYDILSDDKKRREYDDAREAFKSGRIPPNMQGGQGFNGGDFTDMFGPGGDIFSTLFGGARQRHGADLQTEASILFKDAIYGTELNLRLQPQGSAAMNITTRVPAGIKDGAKIKIKGRGAPGAAGPGDLYVTVHVTPHPIFSRKDENIHLTLPVTFAEAALGADIKVPTLEGDEVTVRIAPGTPSGRTLRVKGRGVKKGSTAGDLMITIDVRVPQRVEGAAKKAIEDFANATSDFDPRSELNSKAKS